MKSLIIRNYLIIYIISTIIILQLPEAYYYIYTLRSEERIISLTIFLMISICHVYNLHQIIENFIDLSTYFRARVSDDTFKKMIVKEMLKKYFLLLLFQVGAVIIFKILIDVFDLNLNIYFISIMFFLATVPLLSLSNGLYHRNAFVVSNAMIIVVLMLLVVLNIGLDSELNFFLIIVLNSLGVFNLIYFYLSVDLEKIELGG